MNKVCTKCKQKKPVGDFYSGRATRYKDGYPQCKICIAKKNKQWRRKNKERIKYLSRKQILKGYGLTPDQYDILLESQNGVCAICGKPETRVLKGKLCELAVDHDHKTGRVRGLLCVRCNLGIGSFGDSSELTQKAVEYLKRQES